jgi:dihydroorotase
MMKTIQFAAGFFMSVFLTLAVPAFAQYDVLLKGGHVIDPKNGIDGIMDVAIAAGRISAVAPEINPSQAKKAIDVRGLYVTPGVVDIHTHLFATTGIPNAWAGDKSVLPDGFSFRSGVTTMVDAGSAGWRNFEQFRQTVIDRVKTRVFAFVNIVGLGMVSNFVEQDVKEMNPEQVARIAAKHKDVVVGVKTAHYEGRDWASVDRAVEAGRLANLPVMVDFGFFMAERPFWQLVSQRLRPGDISTHMYRSGVPWIDGNGRLLDYLLQARARGVKFDLGHGGGSLVFRNAVPAIQQKFYPDSISTDLHTDSMNGAMMDFPTVMSKMLAMGMTMAEIVLRSTWMPAEVIHHPELGHLSVDSPADVAVWEIAKGEFGYADTSGGKLEGTERVHCEMTLKDGAIVWDWNARGAVDYRTLGPSYGLRDGADYVIVPK